MNPFIGFVVFLLVAAGILLWPFVNSFRRVPIEKGLKPLWQQRCSGGFRRFGIGGGTNIPFIRVALYSDFMIISGFSTTVIPYQNITGVSLKQNFLSFGGVRLKLRGLKSSYVLYPCDPKTFVGLVESRLALRSSRHRKKRSVK